MLVQMEAMIDEEANVEEVPRVPENRPNNFQKLRIGDWVGIPTRSLHIICVRGPKDVGWSGNSENIEAKATVSA